MSEQELLLLESRVAHLEELIEQLRVTVKHLRDFKADA